MPDTQRSHSPLVRSLSSKDLRSKSQGRPAFKTQHSGERVFESADTALFHELDSLLNRKLHIVDSGEVHLEQNGDLNGSDWKYNGTHESGSNLEPNSGLDDENDDDEDDDAPNFANVDEIDGPISPSSSGSALNEYFQLGESLNKSAPSSPKQFKKSPIDFSGHERMVASQGEMNDEDNNLPVDDALQKLIQEKADEIERGTTAYCFAKPKLDWNALDFYSLFHELSDWFIQKDYSCLKTIKLCFEKSFDCSRFIEDYDYATAVVKRLGEKLDQNAFDIKSFHCLTYVSFGSFQESESYFHHLDVLQRNNNILMTISKTIINCFTRHAECCRQENSNLQHYNTLLFYSGSILFFMINVAIDQKSKHTKAIGNLIQQVEDSGLLLFLTKFINHWRWKSRLSMRIRNIIILYHRIILLQFGDEGYYNEVKEFVQRHHGIEKRSESSSSLTISPIEYAAFREDIISRYPSSKITKGNFPEIPSDPNSLSQFLEMPRPRSLSTSNQSLGEPQVHLATPAPSPPASPTTHTGLKTRKSFQANLSFPAFFPSAGDYETGVPDELSRKLNIAVDETELTYNMEEAIEILSKSVHVTLPTKQLWHERQLFMIQERGWKENNSINDQDPFTYKNIKIEEASTMNRVEKFYSEALPYFSSLVYVLLETMETCNSNNVFLTEDYSEEEVNELQPQLELIRSKEISMESSAAILYLLLKWFKLSHVLKFEYLSSLIYDSKFISSAVDILNCFTNEYQNRIFGKTAQTTHSFWLESSLFNPRYKDTVEIATADEEYKDLNLRMLNSQHYILKILSKITGKKTQRLKDLPLTVSSIFRSIYHVFNLDIYHPILKIVHELAPFKNKRWRADHMELISGVFLYERLPLTDNWITGKDITSEINDAYGQEIALRAMLQFYNFHHYKKSMERCGYDDKASNSFFSREAELLSAPY